MKKLRPKLLLLGVCAFIAANRAEAGGRSVPKTPGVLKADEILISGRRASATKIVAKIKAPEAQAAAAVRMDSLGMQIATQQPQLKNIKGVVVLVPVARAAAAQFTPEKLALKIKELQQTGLFEFVQPAWIYTIQQTPSDTGFFDGTLWGLRNTGQNGGTTGIDINVVPAWKFTSGRPEVVVGVVDTGICLTHQDLKTQLWTNTKEIAGNNIDDDGNGVIDDVHGINAVDFSQVTGNPMDDNNHGSHCSGTIAGTANNGQPNVGIAYNVRLMALKFLDAEGGGDAMGAVTCIDYAISQGAHVLSNSWGGGGPDPLLEAGIQAAHQAGIVFVAAAGNEASDNDVSSTYPASYNVPNIIAVAAVNRHGQLADFSNYGAGSVHLGAPGVEVFSSIASSDNSYDVFAGTSMATPHVAGVVALVKSYFPNATLPELKGRVLATRALASLAGRTITGGLLDANRALTVMADGVLELSATSSISPLHAGENVDFFVNVTDVTPVPGATVTARLGSASPITFRDDATAPDRTANDGTYSATLPVPSGVPMVDLQVSATAPNSAPAAATFTFRVLVLAPNDHFENRIFLPAGTTQISGTNNSATRQMNEPRHPDGAGDKTVWWEWTPAVAGSATISTHGSSFDTTLAVYRSTGALETMELVGENDDTDSITSEVTFEAIAGESYCIQVCGFDQAEGDIFLNYPAAAAYNLVINKRKK